MAMASRSAKIIAYTIGAFLLSSVGMAVWYRLLPVHTRTYSRKVIEAYFTVLIEFLWGKDRIMEVYLNVIEWDDSVFGVEAASEYYFGHSARYLTEEEVKYLTHLIPNSRGYLVD